MMLVKEVSKGNTNYTAQNKTTLKGSSFSDLLEQSTKTRKSTNTKEAAKQYDVSNLDETQREELLDELKQTGQIDRDFHYGFILLPVMLDELRTNPQCMVEMVEMTPTKSPVMDARNMLAFSKQVVDSQMALYQKLKLQGKVLPKLKEQAEQYAKLVDILQELEK